MPRAPTPHAKGAAQFYSARNVLMSRVEQYCRCSAEPIMTNETNQNQSENQWQSRDKQMKAHEKSMKPNGNQWKSMGINGNQ